MFYLMFVFTGSMAGPVSKTLVEIIQSWIFHRDPLSIFTASIIPMLCWKQGRLRAERGRVIESLLESLFWNHFFGFNLPVLRKEEEKRVIWSCS